MAALTAVGPSPTAPQLYARALGNPCSGELKCHWCGSPCDRKWLHDGPQRLSALRVSAGNARTPSSPYVCRGCWFFRLRRVTVSWASGGFQDGKKPCEQGWLLTEWEAMAVRRKEDREKMWEVLRRPPLRFALALRDKEPVQLHAVPVNDHAEVKKDTMLQFTHENRVLRYSVYELEEAIRNKEPEGKEPGVRALIEYFGPPPEIGQRRFKAVADGEPEKHDHDAVIRKEE